MKKKKLDLKKLTITRLNAKADSLKGGINTTWYPGGTYDCGGGGQDTFNCPSEFLVKYTGRPADYCDRS